MPPAIFQASLLFVKLFLCLFVSIILICLAGRSRNISFTCKWNKIDTNQLFACENKQGKWVGLSMLIAYFTIFFAAYYSWPVGDEWLLMCKGEESLVYRITSALSYHFNLNGRLPEMIGIIGGLDRFCWQDCLISPLFVVFAPFAILKLYNSLENKKQAMSANLYIITTACLMLVSPTYYTSYWVNVTYVWTTILSIVLVSLFWGSKIEESTTSIWKLLAAYLLGIYCGWGNETLAQLLALVLTVRVCWLYSRKTPPSVLQLSAYMGLLCGEMMLFTSGSFEHRQALSSSFLTKMSEDYICDFVHHLTWDKVKLLEGASACANLKGIPLHLRCYFAPYCIQMFTNIALVSLCIMCLSAVGIITQKKWKVLAFGIIILMLSIESAIAYLAGAIPWYPAFTPSAIIATCASSYLYNGLGNGKGKNALAIVVGAIALLVYIPDIIQAKDYKKHNIQLEQEIANQCKMGNTRIVLRDVILPQKTMGQSRYFTRVQERPGPLYYMLSHGQFQTDPTAWENTQATHYFQKLGYPIESIERQNNTPR